jgi:hypothetical protein
LQSRRSQAREAANKLAVLQRKRPELFGLTPVPPEPTPEFSQTFAPDARLRDDVPSPVNTPVSFVPSEVNGSQFLNLDTPGAVQAAYSQFQAESAGVGEA